jgi:hypothetical protein
LIIQYDGFLPILQFCFIELPFVEQNKKRRLFKNLSPFLGAKEWKRAGS